MSRHNPFIITRFVFFAILFWINLLSLIFAFWNIGSISSLNHTLPGASVFVLVNALITFLLLIAAYSPVIFLTSPTALVQVELLWAATMSIMQLAAAVDATINGPPVFCRPAAPWGVCASSTILLPTAWTATTAQLAYFLTLLAVVAVHVDRVPGLMYTSIFHVPWFNAPAPRGTLTPSSPKGLVAPPPPEAYGSPLSLPRARIYTPRMPTTTATQRYAGASPEPSLYSSTAPSNSKLTTLALGNGSRVDIEKQDRTNAPILFHRSSHSEHGERPPWAQDARTRRGVDPPFGGIGGGAPKVPPKMKTPHVAHEPAVHVHSRFSFETRSDEACLVLPDRQGTPSSTAQSDDLVVRSRPGNPMEEAMMSSSSLPLAVPRPPHSRQPSETRHISEFPEKVLDEDKPIPTGGTISNWVGAVGSSIGAGSIVKNSTSPKPLSKPDSDKGTNLAEWKEVQAKRGWNVHSPTTVSSSQSSVVSHV
ncbi:hypothetical protein PUNSTDRAFT_144931 [Punctularia strigosozonata HHB-11173 SS5]|uniref:uncharacterized protein n=1 Tax=Punctularia strigosozonata (strain HHB-11173) TaxID=741275 RepID=UPI0004416DED|nr:uncharacterized protein PUNSTDRAFT_144931 [Punctularia strigosozonata HHB-11173 SS5]EIN07456.1 hypothetical protein PUNSTDRAFT_144931 [Punctularia strigosozonata HHB-11173 SS5]